MGLIPQIASDALSVHKYLKKNDINPQKEYSTMHQKNGKFVYTYQCVFDSEEEAKQFQKFCNLINKGLLDI